MASGVYSWSQTAASNATADSTINWAEGMSPAAVDDSARAMMAALSKWRDDLACVTTGSTLVTGGTSTAYTLSTNGSIQSLTNGWTVSVKFHTTNGASPTLALDGLAATAIQTAAGTAVTSGALTANAIYTLTYHSGSSAFLLHSFYPGSTGFDSGTLMLFQQSTTPTGWTKQTTHNDKALRVVSGTASSGGSNAFSTVMAQTTTGSHTLVASELPTHNHNLSSNATGTTGTVVTSGSTGSGSFQNGGNSAINSVTFNTGTSSISFGGNTDNQGGNVGHSHSITFSVQYVDLIIGQKN